MQHDTLVPHNISLSNLNILIIFLHLFEKLFAWGKFSHIFRQRELSENYPRVKFSMFTVFIFFCKTPQPIWTKLGREGLWEEDIQICINKIWLIPPNHLWRGIRKPKMGKSSKSLKHSSRESAIDMLQFLLCNIIMICRFRTGWNFLWIRIIWLIGVTCLLVDCCVSVLAQI